MQVTEACSTQFNICEGRQWLPHLSIHKNEHVDREAVSSLSCIRYSSYDKLFIRLHTSTSHGLAGVEEIFTKCTQFCLTTFAHHAFNQRVRGGAC